MPLLEVEDLAIEYRRGGRTVHAADGVSFAIEDGTFFGLVGESGCGKSTVAKSLLRLLPPTGRIRRGSIRFRGRDLVTLPDAEMRRIRWKDVAYIPQSSLNSLNPVVRVGRQVEEAFRLHEALPSAEAWARARPLFEMVGLDPGRMDDFPHQFSGGMRQRVAIAMAFALRPALVVADEPTTALDVVMQDQILEKIRELHQRFHHAMVLITHDISLVAENCDRVAVMYAGRIVESASAEALFTRAAHPYTLGLENAFPNLRSAKRKLIAIPGAPPNLERPIVGCAFAPRCPFAETRCHVEQPAWAPLGPGHGVACHFPERAAEFAEASRLPETWQRVAAGR
jgi:oligopeptide/dipeptide ABC transporter ATP-binding protein